MTIQKKPITDAIKTMTNSAGRWRSYWNEAISPLPKQHWHSSQEHSRAGELIAVTWSEEKLRCYRCSWQTKAWELWMESTLHPIQGMTETVCQQHKEDRELISRRGTGLCIKNLKSWTAELDQTQLLKSLFGPG